MTRIQFQHPVATVLIGAFMISFSAVWVTLSGVEPTTSAFYRVFFGSLFLAAARIASRQPLQSPARLWLPAAACGLAFALDLCLWHASIRYVGPGLATVLGNFQVFIMALCGVLFFHEKLRLRFVLAMPMAFSGLFLVIGFNWSALSNNYKLGVLYGFLTAGAYTIYLLLLRKIQISNSEKDKYTPLLLISVFAALFLALYMLINDISFAIPTIQGLTSLISLGLLSQAVGWLLIAGSMPKIPASLTGMVLLLQPSLSFIWDVLFFSRPTTSVQWLGTVITLWAIYLGLTGAGQKK